MKPPRGLGALAAAALLVASPAAVAEPASAPPPPKTAAAKAGTAPSSVPPPVPVADRSATDLLSTFNTAAGLKTEALVRAANGSQDLLERGQKYFDAKGNLIAGADVAASLAERNYAEAARKGAAAVVDKCVDAAIAGACAFTGPAAPGCNLAVQAARFCGETYFNQSIGGWTVEQAEGAYGAIAAFAERKRREFREAGAAQEAGFGSLRSQNEDHAAAYQAPPYTPDSGPYPSYDGDAWLDAFVTGLSGAAPASTAPPAAPDGACHSGHDESAHPGGCRSAPLGQGR